MQVTFYLPTTVVLRGGSPLPSGAADRSAHVIGKTFGGCTAWNATGSWYDSQGTLYKESVLVVQTFATGKVKRIVKDLVREIARVYDEADNSQESFGVAINNDMLFFNREQGYVLG